MNTNERQMSESQKLRNMLRLTFRSMNELPKARKLDSIAGYDEMQGYPESGAYGNGPDTVGLSWGDVGHGLNLAVNPVAQYHWMQRRMGGGSGQQQQQQQRRLPGPPTLPPQQTQAFQTGGPSKLLGYMGLNSHIFAAAGATSFILSQEPATAFRIRRLIVSQAKTAGAVGILVTVGAINVSGMPQSPAPNAQAAIDGFSGDATYSLLDLQIAAPGVPIELPVFVSAAPTGADTVTVSATVYGEWLR